MNDPHVFERPRDWGEANTRIFQPPGRSLFHRTVYADVNGFSWLFTKSGFKEGARFVQMEIFTENKEVSRQEEDNVHLLAEEGDGDVRRAYNIIAEATWHKSNRATRKERMGVGWLLGPDADIVQLLEEVLDRDCILELLKHGAALEAQVVLENGDYLKQNPLAHMGIAGNGPTFQKQMPAETTKNVSGAVGYFMSPAGRVVLRFYPS